MRPLLRGLTVAYSGRLVFATFVGGAAIAAALTLLSTAEATDLPACGDPTCDSCDIGSVWVDDSCHQPLGDCYWVRGEYLLWWMNSGDAPPLVTTSLAGTDPDVAGVLGQPGTTVILGDSGVGTGVHLGGRFTLGLWLSRCHIQAIEANYTAVGGGTARFSATSGEISILARPFFDTETGLQEAMLVAHPDVLTGSIAVAAETELQSAEVLWRRLVFTDCLSRLDFLAGYRFGRLDESLRIRQFSEWTVAQGQILPGTTKELFDRFDTENHFHGGQLGLAYQRRVGGCWSLDLLLKVGLGNTRSRVHIEGATQNIVPGGGSADFVGGLLAQETNIGRYQQDEFAVMPELSVSFACDLTCQLRLLFGYDLLYWSKVARPADQIDFGLSQLPPEPPTGQQRPAFQFTSTEFWAQGLQFGLDYRF
jgi:hypothetical protein